MVYSEMSEISFIVDSLNTEASYHWKAGAEKWTAPCVRICRCIIHGASLWSGVRTSDRLKVSV